MRIEKVKTNPKNAENEPQPKHEKNITPFIVESEGKQLTTDTGVKIHDTDNSLRVGPRGPTLMEHFHFREKIMHFDHERIPERVVHARGSGAHGYFQVYQPLTKYTKAKFLQDPSKKTPVFVRFSTVAGSRGSADTVRDVRGFATRFYTEDGNFDLVGNNIPVFFIQDAIKFPDVIHAVKPEQHNEVPQASSAHDTFWDFIVNTPETAHMVMWAMSDRAIPRSFRMMEGFGVNTYRLINEQGQSFFVKFHWKPLLGMHSLIWDEAQKISGKDPDFHRKDLWEAIGDGAFPEYEFGLQIIPESDECKFDFDILDATKIWPEELIPVQRVGKLVLNRNPDNFFAETEQIAFCVGNLVPGIDVSDDPLLQGRLFSYMDTQLTRLGGPNFNQIPINRPLVPVINNHRDGFHQMMVPTGKTAYNNNSLNNNYPMPGMDKKAGYVHYPEMVSGQKVQQRSETFSDHFSQATLFWNSMSEAEKMHIIKAFLFEVGKTETPEIRQKVVDMFVNVDMGLATAIALGVGAEPPTEEPQTKKVSKGQSSKALSMANTIKNSIKTRKIAVLVMPGFNNTELQKVKGALLAQGAKAEVISNSLSPVDSAEGDELIPNRSFITVSSVLYDALYIPGGKKSVEALSQQGYVINFINETFKHCKAIGLTGEATALLKKLTTCAQENNKDSAPKTVAPDSGVVTATTVTPEFNTKLINAIAQHRSWERETIQPVPI